MKIFECLAQRTNSIEVPAEFSVSKWVFRVVVFKEASDNLSSLLKLSESRGNFLDLQYSRF